MNSYNSSRYCDEFSNDHEDGCDYNGRKRQETLQKKSSAISRREDKSVSCSSSSPASTSSFTLKNSMQTIHRDNHIERENRFKPARHIPGSGISSASRERYDSRLRSESVSRWSSSEQRHKPRAKHRPVSRSRSRSSSAVSVRSDLIERSKRKHTPSFSKERSGSGRYWSNMSSRSGSRSRSRSRSGSRSRYRSRYRSRSNSESDFSAIEYKHKRISVDEYSRSVSNNSVHRFEHGNHQKLRYPKADRRGGINDYHHDKNYHQYHYYSPMGKRKRRGAGDGYSNPNSESFGRRRHGNNYFQHRQRSDARIWYEGRKRSLSPESFKIERDRSRERERRRRKLQTECIKKAGGFEKLAQSEGKEPTPVFYDGFQWVAKTGSTATMDPATMNNTRRFRRLYFGNIPSNTGLTETRLQQIIWEEMVKRGLCVNPNENPVLCVWLSQKKKNYGFVEFKTVEETEKALYLDGFYCLGASIKVSRPNDYSQAILSKSGDSDSLLSKSGGIGIAGAIKGVSETSTNINETVRELDLNKITPDTALEMGKVVGGIILTAYKDRLNPPNLSNTKVIKITGLFDDQSLIFNSEGEYNHIKDEICKGTGESEFILSSVIIRPEDIVKLDAQLDKNKIRLNICDVLLELNSNSSVQRSISNLSINRYKDKAPKVEYFDNDFYNKHFKNKKN